MKEVFGIAGRNPKFYHTQTGCKNGPIFFSGLH